MLKQVNSFVIDPKPVKVETIKIGESLKGFSLKMRCPLCDTKRTKPCNHTSSYHTSLT
jgi:hypothetical protein